MLDAGDPLVQIKITESVCAFVAICTTLYRLYIRMGRFWIDDAWAAFALVALFVQIASVFMHVENPDTISKTSRVAAYYLMAITFYCIIWASRISIIYSIVRIDPNPSRRKLYIGVSIVYFITVIVLIVQLFWVCEPEPGWKDTRSPQCQLNKQVAICQLVTDILADLFLLFAPLKVLNRLQDKALRKKLIIIFSTCIITTIVSLVHAAYILTVGGIRVVISALVEDCVSLIIANVPVVVTALLRFASDTDQKPPPTRSIISTAMYFASRKLGLSHRPNADGGTAVLDIRQETVVEEDSVGLDTEGGLIAKGRDRRSRATSATLTNGSCGLSSYDGTLRRERVSEESTRPIMLGSMGKGQAKGR